jgi:ParB-like chromosome segregation protein Spo0J
MAKNFRTQVSGAVGLAAAVQQRTGVRLSDVQYVQASALSINPLNATLFSDETEEYFQKLTSDVKERGILVPLVAKRNGTLLAGHNRLRVARNIGLEVVPVQYVQEELTEAQEKIFVVNDNVLRRHLSDEQRLALYRQLFPNFDERLAGKGRPSRRTTVEELSDKRYDVPFSNNSPLTARHIAQETGQTEGAVKQQFKRMRAKEQQESSASAANEEINSIVLKKLEKALQLVEGTNEVTRKEVLKKLRTFIKTALYTDKG